MAAATILDFHIKIAILCRSLVGTIKHVSIAFILLASVAFKQSDVHSLPSQRLCCHGFLMSRVDY